MSEKIPKEWKWVKLGEVVIINRNESLKKGIIADYSGQIEPLFRRKLSHPY